MPNDIQRRFPNGPDPLQEERDDDQRQDEQLHLVPPGMDDDPNGRDVSGLSPAQPGGVSAWQSPLSIRETIIILLAVAGAIYQWANMSAQLLQLEHDMASQNSSIVLLHQDMTSIGTEIRTHIETPGHPVSLERIAVLNSRVDALAQRVADLEDRPRRK